MKIQIKSVNSVPLLFCLIRADCGAPNPFNTLGRREWVDEAEGRTIQKKKKCWSLSLSFRFCLSLPFSLSLIQYADCFCTENWLPRYSAWPIYHIDQLIKELDIHWRLARNVRMRAIMIFLHLPWYTTWCFRCSKVKSCCVVILLSWLCNI